MARLYIPKLQLEKAEEMNLAIRGYSIKDPITRGGFGTVYRGNHYDTPIAIKALDMDKDNCKAVCKEIFFLKKINHPNVVKVLDIFFIRDKNKLLIFMEFLEGGDLAGYIKREHPEPLLAKLFKQMVDAMAFMHSRGYAHRDLKPGNILLNREMTVAKVCDFGMACRGYDPITGAISLSSTYCGTVEYLAPELFHASIGSRDKLGRRIVDSKKEKYCPFRADVWSMGIMLYKMLQNNQFPFNINRRISKSEHALTFYKAVLIPIQFDKRNVSPEAQELIRKMLSVKVEIRPSMESILGDPWLVQQCSYIV